MIETFKIITGIYDNEVTEGIFDHDPNTRTRGHCKKIKKMIQHTISLEMPVPSQGHYGFQSFPVVD
jgi:hypothetical protein